MYLGRDEARAIEFRAESFQQELSKYFVMNDYASAARLVADELDFARATLFPEEDSPRRQRVKKGYIQGFQLIAYEIDNFTCRDPEQELAKNTLIELCGAVVPQRPDAQFNAKEFTLELRTLTNTRS